jgi:hypothetical protein
MPRFRKKPVVIEAIQWSAARQELPAWLMDGRVSIHYQPPYSDDRAYMLINTLEGQMRAELGDFIIQGVKGEVYPCKADIFAATYEPAE